MSSAEAVPLGTANAHVDAEADQLRREVLEHLASMGIRVTSQGTIEPAPDDKDAVRTMHTGAVLDGRDRARGALEKHEDRYVARLADPASLDVAAIRPRLVPVVSGTDETRLWRWASLHWSVPTSAGYGRRLRYLVVDAAHDDALIGLIGLGDPVFALGARDAHIGWSRDDRGQHLHQIMDAFVLGAVPPYAGLLGGKLVALLATSKRVTDDYRDKYDGRKALISGKERHGPLAAVTTSSALGRSSLYNRLRSPDNARLAYEPVGFTNGSGDFHLHGDIYRRLHAFVASRVPMSESFRKAEWGGNAYRNRREVITRAFDLLGFDGRKMRRHGIRRQVYVAPLTHNYRELLTGAHTRPLWANPSVSEAARWWVDRWALPRSQRVDHWRDFDPESWRIWTPDSPWLA
jgi:hypothetical protein